MYIVFMSRRMVLSCVMCFQFNAFRDSHYYHTGLAARALRLNKAIARRQYAFLPQECQIPNPVLVINPV